MRDKAYDVLVSLLLALVAVLVVLLAYFGGYSDGTRDIGRLWILMEEARRAPDAGASEPEARP